MITHQYLKDRAALVAAARLYMGAQAVRADVCVHDLSLPVREKKGGVNRTASQAKPETQTMLVARERVL